MLAGLFGSRPLQKPPSQPHCKAPQQPQAPQKTQETEAAQILSRNPLHIPKRDVVDGGIFPFTPGR